jgi:hypothetical protein
MNFWGVRFYNDGFLGETLCDDPDWGTSTDEDVLRRNPLNTLSYGRVGPLHQPVLVGAMWPDAVMAQAVLLERHPEFLRDVTTAVVQADFWRHRRLAVRVFE